MEKIFETFLGPDNSDNIIKPSSMIGVSQFLPHDFPEQAIGDLSDGYHSYNQLYDNRLVLFACIVNLKPELGWKSLKHHDESDKMYEDYFIVGFTTPQGDVRFHYHIKYWNLFKCKELPNAPEWNGADNKDHLNYLINMICR
ncbi:MAG: hypothetical protein ACRCXT_21150 [Paraclostridium sp.]